MASAYGERQDDAALAHADRLVRLYPDWVASDYLRRAARLVADIQRRRRAGTLGKPPPKGRPPGFDLWDGRRKAAYLIDSLDEIGLGDRGKEDFRRDRRYLALLDLGDVAIPALIDALERDDRLTRIRESPRPGSGLGSGREEVITPVRELIERALRDILSVSHFEPRLTEEGDADSPAALAARLRRYWAAYGPLPFPDRMLAVLTDPEARPEARAEAAEQLSCYVPPGRSAWSRHPAPDRPAPLADRPGVTAAILDTLDAERERAGRRRRPNSIERSLLRSLSELGDRRAGPEVARRAGEESGVRSRLAYARAAHDLGASGPLVALARELAAGTLALGQPPGRFGPGRGGTDTLSEFVRVLGDSGLPEAEDALYALADPGHQYFPGLLRHLLPATRRFEFPAVFHPVGLAVLRAALTDGAPTGTHYYLRGDEVEVLGPGRAGRHALPAEAAGWHEHVEERVADAAAARLAEHVVGLPEPNPLQPDADRVLAEIRTVLVRHERRFRSLDFAERVRLGVRHMDPAFVPDIRPLSRPATAADMNAGRAVFELDGSGRVAAATWPAWLLLKVDPKKNERSFGLVVQAEVGSDGKVVYGVIFRDAIRAVQADEIERIEPYKR
jgi:hypothetical protein